MVSLQILHMLDQLAAFNGFNSLTLAWINLKVTAILSNLSKVAVIFYECRKKFKKSKMLLFYKKEECYYY